MSMLNCYFAVEKPFDGKPFTVCEVGTWFNINVFMLKDDIRRLNAERLFKLTGTGKDKTERGVTREELNQLIPLSNGGIYLIPKTADNFIKIGESYD